MKLRSNPVLVSGASFPVQGIESISDMDLESKYCYFYHSWNFVPYKDYMSHATFNNISDISCTRLAAASDKVYQLLARSVVLSGYSGFFHH
jgi:hypothetical protein